MGLIISFKNNQTQNGLNAISIKKNKVASAAIKCLVANTKQQFTKPDRTPPNKKQKKSHGLIFVRNQHFEMKLIPWPLCQILTNKAAYQYFY